MFIFLIIRGSSWKVEWEESAFKCCRNVHMFLWNILYISKLISAFWMAHLCGFFYSTGIFTLNRFYPDICHNYHSATGRPPNTGDTVPLPKGCSKGNWSNTKLTADDSRGKKSIDLYLILHHLIVFVWNWFVIILAKHAIIL